MGSGLEDPEEEKMKSTVIIPNYNGIDYLKECIYSLREQKNSNFQICVVDNGSEDGSVLWIKENYPGIQVIELRENTGFCHAVNVGIQASDTKYVILLNNDTVVLTDFVKFLEDSIEKAEDIFSVGARMLDMKEPKLLDGAGDLYCALGWAYARGKGREAVRYYKEREEIFSACAGAAIYRRDLFEEIGYFDENHFAYLEDCDIGYRAQIFGYKNYYEPKAMVYHAGSAATGSRYNDFKVKLAARNNVYLIYKNMPVSQIICNLPFLLPGFFIKYLFFVKKGLSKAYKEGILQGLSLCKEEKGRKNKIKFQRKRVRNYLRIQWFLWKNTFERFLQ